jgi:hypothetical protein
MNLTEPVFSAADLSKWKERLQKELKSPLGLESLQWEVSEYFGTEPVYEQASLGPEHQYLNAFHEEWKKQKPDWKPVFRVSDAALKNAGAETIHEAETYGFTSWFSMHGDSLRKNAHLPVEDRPTNSDPVLESLRLGKWSESYRNLKSKWQTSPFHIHGSDVHNAGGSAVQELAFVLLVAEQYRQSLSETEVLKTLGDWAIHLGTGPSFWLEIAKIRAMRVLWMNFCAQNGGGRLAGNIESETSGLFWSRNDPDGNLLRHTSEVMSAILGGADSILIHPHSLDENLSLESTRQAINIGLLATEEAHIDSQFDPTSGSYLVEILTHKLAKAAWKLFAELNELSFNEWIENGTFQKMVGERLEKLKENYADGKLIMVGANMHKSPMARKSPAFPTFPEPTEPNFPALKPAFLDA